MMKIAIFILIFSNICHLNCAGVPPYLKCTDESCKETISTGRLLKQVQPLYGNLGLQKASNKISIKGKSDSVDNTLWLVENDGFYGFIDVSFIKENKNNVRNDIQTVSNPYFKTDDLPKTEKKQDSTIFSSQTSSFAEDLSEENDETENFSEQMEIKDQQSLIKGEKIDDKGILVNKIGSDQSLHNSLKISKPDELQLNNLELQVKNDIGKQEKNGGVETSNTSKDSIKLASDQKRKEENLIKHQDKPLINGSNKSEDLSKQENKIENSNLNVTPEYQSKNKDDMKSKDIPTESINSLKSNRDNTQESQQIRNTVIKSDDIKVKESTINISTESVNDFHESQKNPVEPVKSNLGSIQKENIKILKENDTHKESLNILKSHSEGSKNKKIDNISNESKKLVQKNDEKNEPVNKEAKITSNQETQPKVIQENVNVIDAQLQTSNISQNKNQRTKQKVDLNEKPYEFVAKAENKLEIKSVSNLQEKSNDIALDSKDSTKSTLQHSNIKEKIIPNENKNKDTQIGHKIVETKPKELEFSKQTQQSEIIQKPTEKVEENINSMHSGREKIDISRKVKEETNEVKDQIKTKDAEDSIKTGEVESKTLKNQMMTGEMENKIVKDSIKINEMESKQEEKNTESNNNETEQLKMSKDKEAYETKNSIMSEKSHQITEESDKFNDNIQENIIRAKNDTNNAEIMTQDQIINSEKTLEILDSKLNVSDISNENLDNSNVSPRLSKEDNKINESVGQFTSDPYLSSDKKDTVEYDREMMNNIKSPIIKLILKLDMFSQFVIKSMTMRLGLDSSSKISQFSNNWLQMSLENFVSVLILFITIFVVVYTPKIFKFNRDWKSEFTRQCQIMEELESKLQSIEEVRHKLTVQNHSFEKVIDEYKQQINEIQEDAYKNKKTVIMEIDKIKKTNETNIKNLTNDLGNKIQQCQLFEQDIIAKHTIIENLEEDKRTMEIMFDTEKTEMEETITKLQKDLRKRNSSIEDLDLIFKQKVNENEIVNLKIHELNQELNDKNQLLIKLEKSIENLKMFEGMNCDEFTEQKKIYLNLTNTKEQLELAQHDVERLQNELTNKCEQIVDLQQTMSTLQMKANNCEQQKINAVALQEAAEVKLKVLSDYFKSKEVEMAKTLGHQVIESTQSMDQVDYLKHRIQILETDNEDMVKITQRLKNEIKEAQSFAAKCKSDANEQINNLFLKSTTLERNLILEKEENKKLRIKLSHYCGPTPPRNINSNFNQNRERPPSRQSVVSDSINQSTPPSMPSMPLIPLSLFPQSPSQNCHVSGRNSVNSKKSSNT